MPVDVDGGLAILRKYRPFGARKLLTRKDGNYVVIRKAVGTARRAAAILGDSVKP